MSEHAIDFTLGGILSLVVATLRSPRVVARRLMTVSLPADALWLMLVTVAVVSALIAQLASLVLIPGSGTEADIIHVGPLIAAGLHILGMLLSVFAVHHVGRLMGGRGVIEASLKLMIWFEVVMLFVQIVQLIILLLLPGLGFLVTMAGLALMAFVLTAFIAEIHGFENPWLVFGGIVATVLVFSFALSLVLTLLGVNFVGGAGV